MFEWIARFWAAACCQLGFHFWAIPSRESYRLRIMEGLMWPRAVHDDEPLRPVWCPRCGKWRKHPIYYGRWDGRHEHWQGPAE